MNDDLSRHGITLESYQERIDDLEMALKKALSALESITSNLGWLQSDGYYENQLHESEVAMAMGVIDELKREVA